MANESMRSLIEYLYQQQPLPSNVEGVEVTVDVVDSNGNYRNIGTATNDATGTKHLSVEFWPSRQAFGDSESCCTSYSSTAFGVDDAPEATLSPTNPPVPLADQYLLSGIGGIIAAIAIVALLIER